MPRSSRSSGGGRAAPAGARGAHTMASSRPQQQTAPAHAPSHQPPAAYQQQQGRAPGLFGQMASTAAGVAVGSTMGHGLSNMLFGGGSAAPAPEAAEQAPQASSWDQGQYANQQQQAGGARCEVQSKDFLRCLEATNNDVAPCSFYLDQLKACQAAARNY